MKKTHLNHLKKPWLTQPCKQILKSFFLAPSAKRCITASGAASPVGVQNCTIPNGPKITAIQKENMLSAWKVRNFFFHCQNQSQQQ